MDITKDNFEEKLPFIQDSIKNCNFVSIDCEFTGLRNGEHNVNFYDNVDERYSKIKGNTDGFLVIQLGLATFQWSDDEEKYHVQVFNFYVFPFSPHHSHATDRIFCCQSSSIDFLNKQGFDFNTAFRKGIPYLRLDEEHLLRKTVEERQAEKQMNFHSPATSPVKQLTQVTDPVALALINDIKDQVKTWLKDTNKEEMIVEQFCNSFIRRVLYETLPIDFPNQLLVETRRDADTNTPKIAVLRGASDELKQKQLNLLKEKAFREVEQTIGLSKIFHCLKENKKLIVGHNMLLDVLFIMRQFIVDLPSTLEEFKSTVSSHFPHIIDTKLMASKTPFKDFISVNALDNLNESLKHAPFGHPAVDVSGKYINGKENSTTKESSYLHEAGYDAFITGNAFLSMFQYLSKIVHPSFEKHVLLVDSDVIKPYLNKIFLYRMHDIPYMNLAGPDIKPQRDEVFHVEFPAVWKSNDLRHLFSPVGAINISWINDTECFVRVFNRSEVKNVCNLMKPEDSKQFHYKIRSYEQFMRDKHEFSAFKRPYINAVPFNRSRFSWTKSSSPSKPTPTPANSVPLLTKPPDSAGTETPSTDTCDNVSSSIESMESSDEPSAKKRKASDDDSGVSSTSSPSPQKAAKSSSIESDVTSTTVCSTAKFEVPAWD